MYIPQVVGTQPWVAGSVLRYQLETLHSENHGANLHLVEWIILLEAVIDNSGAAIGSWQMERIIDQARFVPNQPCDASILSGHAMRGIDNALTGRRCFEPASIGASANDQVRTMALRLPFHGDLIGCKSQEYKDLISPVLRWNKGLVTLTCSVAAPFTIAGGVIDTCDITLIAVTEPFPGEYWVGPSVIYGETVQAAGPTFIYPSAGRTAYMGLHPLNQSATGLIYPTIQYRDICLYSGLRPEEIACCYNAMASLGDHVDGIDLDVPQFIPIVFSRPDECPQWTLPRFPRGNRTVEATGNSATEHRVCWCQLREADDAILDLGDEIGQVPDDVVLTAVDQVDLARGQTIAPTLPRRIPDVTSKSIEIA